MSTSIYLDEVKSINLVKVRKVEGVGFATSLIINTRNSDYVQIDLLSGRASNLAIGSVNNTAEGIEC